MPTGARAQRAAPAHAQGDEKVPTLDGLIGTACEFISAYVLPRTDAEKEYLERFSWGSLDPGLLFEDEAMARAATASPETQWKLQNIRKMQEMGALRFQDYQAQALQSTLATCR